MTILQAASEGVISPVLKKAGLEFKIRPDSNCIKLEIAISDRDAVLLRIFQEDINVETAEKIAGYAKTLIKATEEVGMECRFIVRD